jgi:hypothetical protein
MLGQHSLIPKFIYIKILVLHMSNSNTVASLPKILQNNSKSAEKRI